MGELFAELKRRRIYRAAAAYAVVAWILIQLVAIMMPVFDLPPAVARSTFWFLGLGFPVVLIFAWVIESAHAPHAEASGQNTTARRDWLLTGAVVIVLAIFVYQQLAPRPAARSAPALSANITTSRPAPADQSRARAALDILDADMVATRGVPVRATADVSGTPIGSLAEGESVHVAGRVRGDDWYAIQFRGGGLAYVVMNALQDVALYNAQKQKQNLAAAIGPARAPETRSLTQPVAPATFDGKWTGVMTCTASVKFPAFSNKSRIFDVANGRVSGESNLPAFGAGTHEVYDGRIDPDGTVVISGKGENGQTGPYAIYLSGKIKDGNLQASGTLGTRRCTLAYARE